MKYALNAAAFWLLSLALCSSTRGQAKWPIVQTWPGPIGMQLKENDLNAESLDIIAKMGVKYVRRGALWGNVEKEKGVYDFSRYTKLVADAKARDMNVIITLALQNKLYDHPKDPAGRKAYVNYAVAAAEAFKGQPVIFEIWNEPNTMTFWSKHGGKGNTDQYAEEYVNLVKATVPAMKKADPKCIILGGSMSNVWTESFKWMTFCTKRGVMDTGIDGWSLHPYGVKNPEDYLEAYKICRDIMKDNGSGKMLPFLNTERGFSVDTEKEGANASEDKATSLQWQAWHIVRQYLIDTMCDVQLTVWYEFSGTESFALYDQKNKSFYPAFDAAKVMIAQLDGYKFDERLKTENDRDFVLRFKHKNGNEKLVAWTSPPPRGTPDKTVDHAIQVLVTTTAKSLKVFDIYGKDSSISPKGGSITLELTGAPQYVQLGEGR